MGYETSAMSCGTQISFFKSYSGQNRIAPEVILCGKKLIKKYNYWCFLHIQTQSLLSRHTDQESFAARDKFRYNHYFFRRMGLGNLVV